MDPYYKGFVLKVPSYKVVRTFSLDGMDVKAIFACVKEKKKCWGSGYVAIAATDEYLDSGGRLVVDSKLIKILNKHERSKKKA